MIESINEKDVIRFICTYRLSGRENCRLGNESLLELMPNPELQQRLKLTETFGCLHISRVRPDQFWVSDNRTDLILFNANGDIQYLENKIHVYTDVYDLTGAHTVNKNNDLIYIDTQNEIKLLSNTKIKINTSDIKNKKNTSDIKKIRRTINGFLDVCLAHCYPAIFWSESVTRIQSVAR